MELDRPTREARSTNGAEVPVVATSVARNLPLAELHHCFGAARLQATRTLLVANYDKGFVFAFDFGAVVFVGIEPEERLAVLERIRQHVAAVDALRIFTEEFPVAIQPDLKGPGIVEFYRIVVPELNRSVAEVVARLLAQSVAVERSEATLDELIAALEHETQRMSSSGRLRVRRSRIMKLVASTIEAKNRVIGKLSLLDKPDLAWESEQIDTLHVQLRSMLELEDRFQTVEYKLRAVQETATLLLDIVQGRRSLLLEITIVLLIAVEIGLALFKVT